MRLKVLGCSGGIGSGLRTTSFLIDDDILIDCGSGVGDLSLHEMSHIRHIFLTHSHMDHFVFLPLLVDTMFPKIDTPLVIHAQKETIQVLKDHIFNWSVWPDFSRLPSAEKGVMRFEVMAPTEVVEISKRKIEMIPVNHIIPCTGYRVESTTGAFAFSGDTTTNDTLWQALNSHSSLDLLIVEAAFTNSEEVLSRAAKHYTPNMLAQDIKKLKHRPPVYLSHSKPGQEHTILNECILAMPEFKLEQLAGGEVFEL